MKAGFKDFARIFWACLTFLSIVPNPRQEPLTPGEFGRFPALYPLVGLVFGLDMFIMWHLASLILPARASALLVVILLTVSSRAFHVDGLADAADALFSHKSREEKLTIMKDSRQGTFGVLAIVLDMVLKWELVTIIGPAAPWALILWPVWGRLAASVVAVESVYVGSDHGLGRWMVEESGPRELFHAGLWTLVLSLVLGCIGGAFGAGAAVMCGLAALFLGFLLTWVWRLTLGGVTGDLLGASIELTEIAAAILFYIFMTMQDGFKI
ncbi:MAG: adenosylcobinamide-GDP ribazoletransferase [Candidatus Adiutrix sp.]|jgi:adenosylcobinamide-GDP ribazoletransferase|nr:adenosylcobinamide-GDP ribazoletransferase [Candidatus Adiutrix sp.]